MEGCYKFADDWIKLHAFDFFAVDCYRTISDRHACKDKAEMQHPVSTELHGNPLLPTYEHGNYVFTQTKASMLERVWCVLCVWCVCGHT